MKIHFSFAPRRLGAVCLIIILASWLGAQAATRSSAWRIDEAQTWIGFKIDAVGFPTTHGHFKRYSGQVLIDFLPSMPLPSISVRHRSTISSRAQRCSTSSISRP
jgi:hypothetical protein